MENNTILQKEDEVTPVASTPKKSEKEVSPLHEWTLFLRDICIILVVVLILRTYVVAPFRISGSSMESNYFSGEFILVNKFSFADFFGKTFEEPKRGDVVVIEPHAENGKQFYIKRVIGLPGEMVKIEDGKVSISKTGSGGFVELNETYLSPLNYGKTYPGRSSGTSLYTVPVGEYFIMGDNRNASADSRDCFFTCSSPDSSPFMHRKDIVGKLWVSLGSFKIFDQFFLYPNVQIKIAKDIGFTTPPRFLNTTKSWDYTELSK